MTRYSNVFFMILLYAIFIVYDLSLIKSPYLIILSLFLLIIKIYLKKYINNEPYTIKKINNYNFLYKEEGELVLGIVLFFVYIVFWDDERDWTSTILVLILIISVLSDLSIKIEKGVPPQKPTD